MTDGQHRALSESPGCLCRWAVQAAIVLPGWARNAVHSPVAGALTLLCMVSYTHRDAEQSWRIQEVKDQGINFFSLESFVYLIRILSWKSPVLWHAQFRAKIDYVSCLDILTVLTVALVPEVADSFLYQKKKSAACKCFAESKCVLACLKIKSPVQVLANTASWALQIGLGS